MTAGWSKPAETVTPEPGAIVEPLGMTDTDFWDVGPQASAGIYVKPWYYKNPNNTAAVPAGSFVTHYGKQIHYDGAKDEEVTLEIVGQGPQTSTPAEMKDMK